MARKQRGKGKGPGGPQAQGAPAQQRPQGGGGGGWQPLRDSVRRDIEQAIAALAFAERLHHKMDTQRRLFLDFPHAMEQLRSGALERVAVALSRLYEGGQGFDLQRFLRDLPLALGQLAASERSKSQPPPAASTPPPAAEGASAAAETATESATAQPSAEGQAPETPAPAAETAPVAEPAQPAAEPAQPVSPRLELRAKLLAAAPQLAKAATSYRRNVATLKRASLPRRSPGPWRADREVLEEARRAVDFVQKLYDAYAEAWADQPLTPNLYEQTAGELDRFLAWTQLDRYVELAVLASTNAPRPPKPGQHVISASREGGASAPPPAQESTPPAQPVTEASPGAVVAAPEPGPAGELEEQDKEEPAAENPPVAEPEPGHA